MKILTLNKSQEKKLLALCKQFFPEYSFIMTALDEVGFGNQDKDALEKIVHWYQLCLTELPKRIWQAMWTKKELDNGVPTSLISGKVYEGRNPIPVRIVNQSQHPVDFLYKFVQECKKNKYFK